jgi:hypothetical protein
MVLHVVIVIESATKAWRSYAELFLGNRAWLQETHDVTCRVYDRVVVLQTSNIVIAGQDSVAYWETASIESKKAESMVWTGLNNASRREIPKTRE